MYRGIVFTRYHSNSHWFIYFTDWFLIIKRIGVTKLKMAFIDNNSIIVGNDNIPIIIFFSEVQKIDRTFLFKDFPFRISYGGIEENKKLYFLPKAKFIKAILGSENFTIEDLRNVVKILKPTM